MAGVRVHRHVPLGVLLGMHLHAPRGGSARGALSSRVPLSWRLPVEVYGCVLGTLRLLTVYLASMC